MDGRIRIQNCLQHNRVVVIGMGGIGSNVVRYLGLFLNSLRRGSSIRLVDGDAFELHNSARMFFTRTANKAVELSDELARLAGDHVRYLPVPEYVTEKNIGGIIGDGDLVFLCVDNHTTRLLVNTHCQALRSVVLISGGNDGVENGKDGTFGNVQVFIRCDGVNVTNALTAFHPEIAHPADSPPDELSCGELIATSVPQLLFTNLAVASAMLNAFYCCLYDELRYEEVYLDIKTGRMTPVRREVNKAEKTFLKGGAFRHGERGAAWQR